MKAQLVYLSADEDLASARDKISWTKSPRVVLVWPERGSLFRRRLDLILLRRQAQRVGADLGIVATDPVVLDNAGSLGIPVFASADRLPERLWRGASPAPTTRDIRRRPPSQPARPLPILGLNLPSGVSPIQARRALMAIIALAWGGVALVTLPWAQVYVAPRQHVRQMTSVVRIDPSAQETRADGMIPGRLATVRVQGEMRRETTGSVAWPEKSASGEVIFTNLSSEAVTVPAGTGLRAGSSGIRYLTKRAAQLAARKGSQAIVPIEAVEPGSGGNLPPGRVGAVEGETGLFVSVTNPASITGGTDATRPGVAEDDAAALRNDLALELKGKALQAMQSQLAPGEVVADRSLELLHTHREEYDHHVGDAADSIQLYLDVEFEGLIYSLKDVAEASNMALLSQLGPGWTRVPGSYVIEEISDPLLSDTGLPSLHVVSRHAIYSQLDLTALRRGLRGRTVADALSYVARQVDLETQPRAAVWPSWLPWLPWVDARIALVLPWEGG